KLSKDEHGNTAATIESFLSGPEMMALLRAQAQHFGADCRFKRVEKVDFSCRPLRVAVDGENPFAESVILATGASARWLNIPSEEEYKNYGVSACATCDGSLFKDKDVIVVGGGDTAMEEANYLTRHCNSVTVVHRREEFRASAIMLERARANDKIKWILNSRISEILGQQEGFRKFVTGVRVQDVKTGEEREVPTDGVFMAIGHKPNTDIFKDQIDMDDLGYIRTRGRSTVVNNTNGEMLP